MRLGSLPVRLVALVGFLAVLASCARSLTDYAPYSQYVGQSLTLKEPMLLVEESLPSAYSNILMVRHAQIEPEVPLTWKILASLPVGTGVTITKVRWIRSNNSGGWVLAVGRIDEGAGELAGTKFTYFWGEDTLNRAPWEDASTPAKRKVGFGGRKYQQPEPVVPWNPSTPTFHRQ